DVQRNGKLLTMRSFIGVLASLTLVLLGTVSRAVESTSEYSVQVSVQIRKSPAEITLSWPQDRCNPPTAYTVYRKDPNDLTWGSGMPLSASTPSYGERNVVMGVPYEYQVEKTTQLYAGYGYVYAGIEAPATEERGKLLLVIDKTYSSELAPELALLEQDLRG